MVSFDRYYNYPKDKADVESGDNDNKIYRKATSSYLGTYLQVPTYLTIRQNKVPLLGSTFTTISYLIAASPNVQVKSLLQGMHAEFTPSSQAPRMRETWRHPHFH